MTDKLKANQKELATSVIKKTWVEPTVQIISVQTGVNLHFHEADATPITVQSWYS